MADDENLAIGRQDLYELTDEQLINGLACIYRSWLTTVNLMVSATMHDLWDDYIAEVTRRGGMLAMRCTCILCFHKQAFDAVEHLGVKTILS